MKFCKIRVEIFKNINPNFAKIRVEILKNMNPNFTKIWVEMCQKIWVEIVHPSVSNCGKNMSRNCAFERVDPRGPQSVHEWVLSTKHKQKHGALAPKCWRFLLVAWKTYYTFRRTTELSFDWLVTKKGTIQNFYWFFSA